MSNETEYRVILHQGKRKEVRFIPSLCPSCPNFTGTRTCRVYRSVAGVPAHLGKPAKEFHEFDLYYLDVENPYGPNKKKCALQERVPTISGNVTPGLPNVKQAVPTLPGGITKFEKMAFNKLQADINPDWVNYGCKTWGDLAKKHQTALLTNEETRSLSAIGLSTDPMKFIAYGNGQYYSVFYDYNTGGVMQFYCFGALNPDKGGGDYLYYAWLEDEQWIDQSAQ